MLPQIDFTKRFQSEGDMEEYIERLVDKADKCLMSNKCSQSEYDVWSKKLSKLQFKKRLGEENMSQHLKKLIIQKLEESMEDLNEYYTVVKHGTHASTGMSMKQYHHGNGQWGSAKEKAKRYMNRQHAMRKAYTMNQSGGKHTVEKW